MSLLAAIRPDAVNLPLFLHVLGAMLLTGAVFTVAATTTLSRRGDGDAAGLRRFAFKTVIMGVLPTYFVMRIAAQWTEAEEDLPPAVEDSTWITIGYITAELGMLLVLVSVVLAAIGLKRVKTGGGEGQARAVQIISILLLVAFAVAIWAMSAKPS